MKKIIAIIFVLLICISLIGCEKEVDFSHFKIAKIKPCFSKNIILYEVNNNKVTVFTGDGADYYGGFDEDILKENFLENRTKLAEFELTDKELNTLKSNVLEIYNDDEENRPFVADAKATLIGVNNKTIRYYGWKENSPYINLFDVFDNYFEQENFWENE